MVFPLRENGDGSMDESSDEVLRGGEVWGRGREEGAWFLKSNVFLFCFCFVFVLFGWSDYL